MAENTDTISIRVPSSLKAQLEKLSEKQQLNMNLLINQILTKNVEWDEHISKMGWLQFEPSTVKEIFERLDEQKISEISKSIKNDIINSIKFIYGGTSLENTIDFMEMWLRSTNSSFRHTEDEKSHKFIIKHNIGKNWSTFAVKVTEEFVLGLGYLVANTSAEKDVYSFEILKN